MFDKTMLLDGDIFLYMVTTQCEEEINWGDDLFTLHSDFKKCRDKLADTITFYQNILLCKHIAIALTHKLNFRKKFILNINLIENIYASQLHTRR